MLRVMNSADQSVKQMPEAGFSSGTPGQQELTFKEMLDLFYHNQCPSGLLDPKVTPPANLKDRNQG